MAKLQSFGAGFDYSEFKKGLDEIVKLSAKSMKGIVDDVRGVESELNKIDPPVKKISKLGNEFADVSKMAAKSDSEVKKLNKSLDDTAKTNSKLKKTADSLNAVGDSAKGAGDDVDDLQQKLKKLSDQDYDIDINLDQDKLAKGKKGLGGIAEGLGGISKAAGAAAVVAGIVVGLSEVYSIGTEVNKTLRNVANATGLTAEESEKLKMQATDLYGQGFADDISGAITSLGELQSTFKGIASVSPDDFGDMALVFDGLSKAANIEFEDVAKYSRNMFQQFGIDAEEGTNLIAYGFQNAKTAGDDFLETINEYSIDAARAGLSAEEFIGFLSEGSTQVRELDKLGDTVRELALRMGDLGTVDALEGFKEGASSAEKEVLASLQGIVTGVKAGDLTIAEGIQAYGDSAKKAFDSGEISESLQLQITDALAGGIAAEEVGPKIVAGLAASFGDPALTAGIAEAGATASEQFSNALVVDAQGIEGLKRIFTTLAVDLSDTVIPIVNELAGVIGLILPEITPLLKSVTEFLAPILVKVAELIGKLLPPIIQVVDVIFEALAPVIDVLIDAVLEIVDAFLPVIDIMAEMANLYMPLLSDAILFVVEYALTSLVGIVKIVAAVMEFTGNIMLNVAQVVIPIVHSAVDFLTKVFGFFAGIIEKVTSGIARFIGGEKEAVDTTDELAAAVGELEEEEQTLDDTLDDTTEGVDDNTDALGKNSVAVKTAKAEINSYIKSLEDNNKKTQSSVKALADELATITNDALAATRAKLVAENDALMEQQKKLQQQLFSAKVRDSEFEPVSGISFVIDEFRVNDSAVTQLHDSLLAEAVTIREDMAAELAQIATDFTAEGGKLIGAFSSLASLDLSSFLLQLDEIDLSAISDGIENLDSEALEEFTKNVAIAGAQLGEALYGIGEEIAAGNASIAEGIVKGLQAMIPAAVVQITTMLAIANPFLGLLAGAGIGLALYGLLGIAENALGAHEGGTITADYSAPKHALDTIPVWLEPGEFVTKTNIANNPFNKAILQTMNDGGDLTGMLSDSFVGASNLHLDGLTDVELDNKRIAILSQSTSSVNAPIDTALLANMANSLNSIDSKMDTLVDEVKDQVIDVTIQNNNRYFNNETRNYRVPNSHR